MRNNDIMVAGDIKGFPLAVDISVSQQPISVTEAGGGAVFTQIKYQLSPTRVVVDFFHFGLNFPAPFARNGGFF